MGAVNRAERNIKWIEQHCYIPEGKFVGQKVKLRPWQKKIVRQIYGTDTRTAIVSYGRKNAKTTLAGFLCLLHTCGPEAVRNSQLISAAQSRDQAALLFALMAKMVRMNPEMDAELLIRDSVKQILCPAIGTVYTAVSADAKTKFGASPVFVVHDELGQVVGPRSALYEALETAQGAHDHPLSIIISTQAPTDADLLSILIDDAKTKADPRTKLFLWTADEDLDPFKVSTIKKANPAYGDFLNAEEVKTQASNAKRMPSREADYRNLILNQRVNRNDPFVSHAVWAENGLLPRSDDFAGGVVVGLDLSERNDLTALIVTGKGADDQTSIECHFYAPAEGIQDRAQKDRVPYDLWAKQGFLHTTPGPTVDYEFVAMQLQELSEKYGIIAVKFDRWRMKYLRKELERLEIDLPLVDHGQGYRSMAPALDALEADLLNKRLRHGNHPVLTWNAANAVVERDATGNRKLTKAKSTGRIDGMVALAMTRDEFDNEGSIDDWLMAQ
jgi:phage terminase large subunit-like protein